jgi:hypothetical protein
LTFDQNSPNTKVRPAITNVAKSDEFCRNFEKSQLYRVGRGLQAESFGFKKVGFGSEMENPHR